MQELPVSTFCLMLGRYSTGPKLLYSVGYISVGGAHRTNGRLKVSFFICANKRISQ